MNDKKKNPLEGIFAQVTDDGLLRENGLLYAENKQLQSNWNSLREYVENEIDFQSKIGRTYIKGMTFIGQNESVYRGVLDKMNELEGKDNNGIMD